MKYLISLLFGIVVGSLTLEYVKYRNLQKDYEDLLKRVKQQETATTDKSNTEELKRAIEDLRQEIEKNKEALDAKEKLLNEFRIKVLEKETEGANYFQLYQQEKLKNEKITTMLNLNNERITKLSEIYTQVTINNKPKHISHNLFNLFLTGARYFLYLYSEFKNNPQKFKDYLERGNKKVDIGIWDIRANVMPLDLVSMNYFPLIFYEIARKGIFFTFHDLYTYVILHPVYWRVFNKTYFDKFSVKDKMRIISYLKTLNIEPATFEFLSRIKKSNLIYDFYKLLLSIVSRADDESQFKFWIFSSLYYPFSHSIYKFDIAPFSVPKEKAVALIRRYYTSLLSLTEKQIFKITPHIRIFVEDAAKELKKIKKKTYKFEWLDNLYTSTQQLYFTTLHQLLLEEKIMQYLDNEQLYKVGNRMIESKALFFTISEE